MTSRTSILSALRTLGPSSVTQLAAHLACSRKTVYREIAAMRKAGVKIEVKVEARGLKRYRVR